jgi:HEPN domain-containing protein
MLDSDRQLALGQLWVSKARTDLAAATLFLRDRSQLEPWTAAFHAREAAEKAVTGVLVARSIEHPRNHDLLDLVAALPDDVALPASAEDLRWLNEYSDEKLEEALRTGGSDPTWEEAEAAVVVARGVFDAVTAQLRGR